MVNEVSFYGQSVKNNSKKHMKTYGKNNNLIFHFALPSVLTSDYFFWNEKKKNSGQKKKYWLLFRNCICTQISRNFSFPSKAYCKITMPYVYRCIKTQMMSICFITLCYWFLNYHWFITLHVDWKRGKPGCNRLAIACRYLHTNPILLASAMVAHQNLY